MVYVYFSRNPRRSTSLLESQCGWAQPGDSDRKLNGTTVSELEYDSGWIIEGAIGNKISDLPNAYELAISYQENEINEASESTDVDI